MSCSLHQPANVGRSWVEEEATEPAGGASSTGLPPAREWRTARRQECWMPARSIPLRTLLVDGAQVLADDVCMMAMCLDRYDGQQLVERHLHVDALVGLGSGRIQNSLCKPIM